MRDWGGGGAGKTEGNINGRLMKILLTFGT